METYRMTVNQGGSMGAVKRIRNPNPHDVLCGRGGGCNSFAGNCTFREHIRVRKNRYNLAPTKAEKARVANEVIDLVRNQDPPGRFLQRDPNSSPGGPGWWIECDEAKAMAKTSQALREGAPGIRAAHKDELDGSKRQTRKRRTRSKKNTEQELETNTPTLLQPNVAVASSPVVAGQQQPLVAPPMPPLALQQPLVDASYSLNNNTSYAPIVPAQKQQGGSNYENFFFTHDTSPRLAKKARISDENNQFIPPAVPNLVHPEDETPPLQPVPAPFPLNSIAPLGEEFPMPAMPAARNISSSMHRANSLALSDLGMSGLDNWGDTEFVNPFDDESELVGGGGGWIKGSLPSPMMTPPTAERNGSNGSNNSHSKKMSPVAKPRLSMDGSGSYSSELSDLGDKVRVDEPDFTEGMKAVYDAAHPGLATPGNNDDEVIPTHLYPFHHSGGGFADHHHHAGSSSNNSSPKLIMSS